MAKTFEKYKFRDEKWNANDRRRRAMAVIRGRLTKLKPLQHPAFRLFYGEGYKAFAFGISSGPFFSISAVTHDLAHIVEFGDNAFRTRGRFGWFKFKLKQITVGGREYNSPLTPQATLRECRAFGIQYRIEQRLGIAEPLRAYIRDTIHTMRLMPDYLNVRNPKELRREILKAYAEITDATIDARLTKWFDSTKRSKLAQEYFNKED